MFPNLHHGIGEAPGIPVRLIPFALLEGLRESCLQRRMRRRWRWTAGTLSGFEQTLRSRCRPWLQHFRGADLARNEAAGALRGFSTLPFWASGF